MNIGDYVRFNYRRVSTPIQIAKITEIHYDSEDGSNCYSTDVGLVIDKANLVKEPSKNPIDLIEVGDYVNGYKVLNIYNDKVIESIRVGIEHQIIKDYTSKDIKSIVTKEQFERMEYKL